MESPRPVLNEEQQERPAGVLEVDSQLVGDITELLGAGERGMLLNILADLYPVDLARLLTHLPFDQAQRVFQWLPVEEAGEVLTELDDAFRAALLEETHPERITELLDQLETDDAADVLADLPVDVASQVLPGLEDVEDVRELLAYDEDSAGGIMATEYVAAPQDWTVAEATEEVRRNAEAVEHLYALFVLDGGGRLAGIVSLKRLLLSPASALLADIMDPDVISVTTDVDQEHVARIMERYDIVSLPVVDGDGRLVGQVSIDDVVDVIREEAEEDIQLMSGVSGGEGPTSSVLRISRGRLPWLVIGLIGTGLSGSVINSFQGALQEAVVLATFIPVVMAMAGNAGIQSSALVVQGLASGEVWASDLLRRLGKEVLVALLNGAILACLLALAVVLLPLHQAHAVRLALTASLSLLTVIVLATCLGTLIPLALHRLGFDPALSTGPFITASNDILGLTVFFLLATLLYL